MTKEFFERGKQIAKWADNNITKDTALKLAISTLQEARRRHFYCEDTYYSCPKHEDGCADDRQPYICNCGADELNAEIGIAINACKLALEQPAQEPVAWMHRHAGEITEFNDFQSCQYCEPLYTHPYQVDLDRQYHVGFDDGYEARFMSESKSWQGLSDDEIVKELERTDEYMGKSFFAGVRWAEQALKEKNT